MRYRFSFFEVLCLCLASLLLFPRVAPSQILRETSVGGVVARPTSSAGGFYALVIGISDYPGALRLKTARNDAVEIGEQLKATYGFKVEELLDHQATRDNILRAVKAYKAKLRPEDSLLIYYAGHGASANNSTYWLPVDANSVDSSRSIISDELTADIRSQTAKHVLLVADSCYSGNITRTPVPVARDDKDLGFLVKMLALTSRTVMSSGGNEPVTDDGGNGHSVFAEALLRALKNPGSSSFTAEHLFSGIQQNVGSNSHQVPQYRHLLDSGDTGGDFVFINPAEEKESLATLASTTEAPLMLADSALDQAAIERHPDEIRELRAALKDWKTPYDVTFEWDGAAGNCARSLAVAMANAGWTVVPGRVYSDPRTVHWERIPIPRPYVICGLQVSVIEDVEVPHDSLQKIWSAAVSVIAGMETKIIYAERQRGFLVGPSRVITFKITAEYN